MANPAFMTLTGVKQGKIEGSVDSKGREKSIQVEQFEHEISLPTTPHAGAAVGQRIHKGLTIHKAIDKSTPKLHKALSTGEHFSELEIKWYRINANGEEQHYFTHNLTDATIISIKPYMHNIRDPQTSQYDHMEAVTFAYRKIIWTWVDGGISAEDDWKDRPTA